MGGLPPAMRLVGIGWYVALCIAAGVVGGVWLDGKFGTSPLLTLIGLFAGLGLAFYGGYRMLMEVIATVKPKTRD